MGYQTITVGKGSTTAIGVQFDNVADGEAGIPLKSCLTIQDPRGSTSCNNNADQIQVFTGYGWVTYYFYKLNPVAAGKWVESTDSTHTEIPDTLTVKSGEAFFFRRANLGADTVTVTLAGGVVPLSEKKNYSVNKGATVAMAWPWPEAMKIKDFNNYNPDPRGSTSCNNNADQIQVFTGYGWVTYYFYKLNPVAAGKWVESTDSTHTEIGDDKMIEAGSAFFFRRANLGADSIAISFERK